VNDAAALHQTHFGGLPSLVVDSPGRINLIGDHTDYCGLPVLPMAIREAIQIAGSARPQPGLSVVSSFDGTVIDSTARAERPRWARYVMAVLDEVSHLAAGRGAMLALDSDLPATGGLSSSSALSVGCLIVLNELWNLELSPEELITTALAAETAAAIAGGAMDQTVITFARPGYALRIDFDPPARSHVPMPDDFVWIAAYSGTRAPKGESAAAAYNSFVLASRAAATILGEMLHQDVGRPPLLSRVRNARRNDLAELPVVSVAQAAQLAGGDALGLASDRELDLRISAEHVLAEAARVDAAERALGEGDIETFGRLMDESHSSLRRYGSSTAALDLLVSAATSAGAAGARVTGAGFGGWAIALALPDRTSAVEAAMDAACGGPTFVATAEGGALWSLNKQ